MEHFQEILKNVQDPDREMVTTVTDLARQCHLVYSEVAANSLIERIVNVRIND